MFCWANTPLFVYPSVWVFLKIHNNPYDPFEIKSSDFCIHKILSCFMDAILFSFALKHLVRIWFVDILLSATSFQSCVSKWVITNEIIVSRCVWFLRELVLSKSVYLILLTKLAFVHLKVFVEINN